MNFKRFYLFLGICLLGIPFGYSQKMSPKINGITVVGSPRAYKSDPLAKIKEINSNWITLVPYGFTQSNDTEIRFNLNRQWWGEKAIGIKENARLAKANGLSVMLKPQVYMHGAWVGEYDLATEKEWKKWEESYEKFMLFYAELAAELDIEMLCVGTEYKIAVNKREAFWRALIKKIRTIYCGKLTYSSNWDGYDQIKIWDELDYIGLSAYFPLDESKTPSKKQLEKNWLPIIKKLKKYSEDWNKPMLFTEYGYLSVDGCAGKTWELEKKVKSLEINEKAQAVALDALHSSFSNQTFWEGGFLWKWFPEKMGHEGYPERDYTPQNKEGQAVLKKWFSQ